MTVNLSARFTLDDDKAREWLARIIGTDGYAELGETAADICLAGDWSSASPGAEWTAEKLIQAAMEDEIIGCPAEMEIYFDYDDGEDGGYYRFLTDIGADAGTMVRLSSLGCEVRKLGDPAAEGAAAAAAVLSEAVATANNSLDRLAGLITDHWEDRES